MKCETLDSVALRLELHKHVYHLRIQAKRILRKEHEAEKESRKFSRLLRNVNQIVLCEAEKVVSYSMW